METHQNKIKSEKKIHILKLFYQNKLYKCDKKFW